MEQLHPVLGRLVASYRFTLLRVESWGIAVPLAALAGVILMALQPGASSGRIAVSWAAVGAAVVLFALYQVRERSITRPLEIYENGFIWSDGSAHAELLFRELVSIRPEERRRGLRFWSSETWWVVEAEDDVTLVLGPEIQDHRDAARWISLRAADTDSRESPSPAGAEEPAA